MAEIFENICECVIVSTSPHEDQRLKDLEEQDKKYAQEYNKSLFMDGRDHIPDVDCKICGGTGKLDLLREIMDWCKTCSKDRHKVNDVFKDEAQMCRHCLWVRVREQANLGGDFVTTKPYWYDEKEGGDE